MDFTAKAYPHLSRAPGLSGKLVADHLKLYAGYVAAANALLKKLQDLPAGSPERAEVRRRFGWEYNGMRLHELYFENLAPKTLGPSRGASMRDWAIAEFRRKLAADFGGLGRWEADFRAVGSMRGIGWAVLCVDVSTKRMFNVWIDEHDGGHLTGAAPLLVMDVFEHAYLRDYGLGRGEYIRAFCEAIDWKTVAQRHRAAVGA
jgi:Fe-Mn family superoxide dismutase